MIVDSRYWLEVGRGPIEAHCHSLGRIVGVYDRLQ